MSEHQTRVYDEAVGAASFILSLRGRGIRDTGVLRAMERVSREAFAPSRFSHLARSDIALPLSCGQTMTAPAVVATMLTALSVEPGHRILEIGTGSGYVTALLVQLGASVQSIERFRTLMEAAGRNLQSQEAVDRTHLIIGDGLAAPDMHVEERFDRILVNGALPSLPPTLTSRLSINGRLVGAVVGEGGPHLILIERREDGTLSQERAGPVRLAPLAGGMAEAL